MAKHVIIQAPARTGSTYFNYKKHLVLFYWQFVMPNIDLLWWTLEMLGVKVMQAFTQTVKWGRAIEENLLNLPEPETLDGCDANKFFPYCFVTDEAFGLKPHMMRPYPRKDQQDKTETIFNYRLSRARRVIENSFGILASRFRVFRRPIISSIDNVKSVTKAAVGLHNFLMVHNQNGQYAYCPADLVDQDNTRGMAPGRWRNDARDTTGLVPIYNQGSNNYAKNSKNS